MNETLKTAGFVGAGAALVLAAWLVQPAPPPRGAVNDAGQVFFPEFTDPLAAASLEIVEYDADSGSPQAFKVARTNGIWSIPSHENYAADAEKQFAKAAAEFMHLVKGNSVSDKPSEHELFGTIDPTAAPAGASGVGKRIAVAGDDGRSLGSLIVGKEVRETKGQHYVRVPGQDRVYLCKIDVAKFPTKFGDWIEKDLLKLDSNDIEQVYINDYSIDEVNQRLLQGDMLKLAYDSKKYDWKLEGLADGEKLDANKLNALRAALDDLKIADVHRKPSGLSAELRTAETMRLDPEAVQSLASRGFIVYKGQLLSNQGETIVRTKEGVQYMLRFGEIAPLRPGTDVSDGEGEEGHPAAPGAPGSDQGRYLFVTAEFNPDLIPKPELETMPDPAALGIDLDAEEAAAANPETPDNGSTPPSGDAEAKPTIKQAMEQARQKIDEENKKKQDEYQRQVEAGQKRVKELNDRFADWYYVISDATYGKIRLRRSEILTTADAPQAGS